MENHSTPDLVSGNVCSYEVCHSVEMGEEDLEYNNSEL
jgi:hypothetical protein